MTGPDEGKTERRLESWKEIAGFFDRDEKTVRRWEKDLGLPVHRLPGVSKGRVYAFAHELKEWSNRPRESKLEVAAESFTETIASPLPVVVPAAPSLSPMPTGPSGNLRPVRVASIAVLAVILTVLAIGFGFPNRRFALASLRLGSPATVQDGVPHRPNPEAEKLYLEGRYYWNERTAAGLTRAVEDFTQAILLDPKDAKAYAGLADSYNLFPEYTAMPEDEAFPRAETAARKAIELDPNLPEAHRALAFPSCWWRHDVFTADREFKRSIALNPNDGTAHLWYANFLGMVGENARAVEEVNRAQELDPPSSSVRADKGRLLYLAGRKDEALALLRQMKRNDPTFVSPHRYLAQIYFMEADYPQYLLEAEEAARLANRPDEQSLVEAAKRGFALGGAHGLLQSMLDAQKKLCKEEKLPVYALAETSAMLGNKAEALQYLITSRTRHETMIAGLETDFALRNLHDEPAYKQLVAEVGFPPLNK